MGTPAYDSLYFSHIYYFEALSIIVQNDYCGSGAPLFGNIWTRNEQTVRRVTKKNNRTITCDTEIQQTAWEVPNKKTKNTTIQRQCLVAESLFF